MEIKPMAWMKYCSYIVILFAAFRNHSSGPALTVEHGDGRVDLAFTSYLFMCYFYNMQCPIS
jgi:hypothetical protein